MLISQAILISHSKFPFLFNKCKTFNLELVCLDDEESHFWTLKLKERNPVNILSREEQDITSQDANSHQRLSWRYNIVIYPNDIVVQFTQGTMIANVVI